MVNTVKEYVQVYPLNKFPILEEFCTNLHTYSQDKSMFWELFIASSLQNGLKVICRILENYNGKQVYDAYVSMIDSPINDLFSLGLSYKETEEDIVKMLNEYSDSVFSIDGWNKESMQKFFIVELLKEDFKDYDEL